MTSGNSWNQSKNHKVLILGDGYMGGHLQKHLETFFTVEKVSSKDLDYHQKQPLYKKLVNSDIQTVINCSGFTGKPNIDEAEIKKELCWELNVMSPLRVNYVCDLLNRNYIHISSGCVFDGYQQDWTEHDTPNYGLFQNHSSFYSKSKHAFELLSQEMKGRILRIRMPFMFDGSSRNYLYKIGKYDKLIDYQNSKTYIPDLCGVVETILKKDTDIWTNRQIYNVVNPGPLWTHEVCDIMKSYGKNNPNWKFVNFSELGTTTSRSNCIMSCDKVNSIYHMRTETEALIETFESWKRN